MAIKTNKEFCQEVLYEVYGGMPPSDARITERFVLTKLYDQIANLATVNAFANNNIEGVTYADDVFYVAFNSLALTDDAPTGYKVLTLPAMPVGLPSQRSLRLTPTSPVCDEQRAMIKMMPAGNVQRMHSLPPVRKVFAFVQGSKLFFYINPKMFPLLELSTVNLTMATAATGLDGELNMPQDMIMTAKTRIVAELRASLMIPQDIKNDGQEIKEPQA